MFQIDLDFKALHAAASEKMSIVWPQLWSKIAEKLNKKLSEKNLKDYFGLWKSDDITMGKQNTM